MKKTLIAFGVALGCALNANAQSAVADNITPAVVTTTGGDAHDCIMRADASTWATLGLTAEQTKKANDIVAACKKEHDTASMEKGSVDHAKMQKHEADLNHHAVFGIPLHDLQVSHVGLGWWCRPSEDNNTYGQ